MVQAIESYRIGMFDACIVMVRNTIDATMLAALYYEVVFNENKTSVWYLKPIIEWSKYDITNRVPI